MGRSDCTQQAIDRWVAKVGDPVRSRLMRFRAAMDDDGFQSSTVRAWLSQARLFLWYLAARKKDPEKAQPSDVRAFIQTRLMRCRERRGHSPAHVVQWRCGYTGAIHRLLREIQGQWPPKTRWALRLEDYKEHLIGRRLDLRYVRELCFHARQFLEYNDQHGLALETIQPSQVTTRHLIQERITRALEDWEPRLRVESVAVEPDPVDPQAAIATITYKLVTTQTRERVSLTVALANG